MSPLEEQTVLKITLAGLLHDIGKFAQGSMTIPKRYANDNADQYQPFYNNRHSHVHSLYTAAFIEQFAADLPPQMNSGDWGEGDSFINLAAGHHKPETPLQWIITQADRMSSGLDRATFEEGEKIAYTDFKKTRLLPILEALGQERCKGYSKRDDYVYRYALETLSASSIFPLRHGEKSLKGDAQMEYQRLFDIFTKQLPMLQGRQDHIEIWAEHLDSLLCTCTSLIPAARVGDVINDVSLYDHGRSTAAFAAALYKYHLQNNNLHEKAIRDQETEKFLLVTGDFYGIQDFIFSAGGEMKKFRSKILRGRSFAVSLMAELAADLVCRDLGLTGMSVVLNAAGKFTLLAANTAACRAAIIEAERKINDWLYTLTLGQASIGLAVTAGAAREFHAEQFAALYDRHMEAVQERKRRRLDIERYTGPVEWYLDSFEASLDRQLCGLCGKRAATKKASSDRQVLRDSVPSCSVCRDHVMIGANIVNSACLCVFLSEQPSTSRKSFQLPLFGCYQVQFCDSMHETLEVRPLKKWQLNPNPDGSLLTEISARPLNGYIPLYRPQDLNDERILASRRKEEKTVELIEQIEVGEPKTFAHIAIAAKNLPRGDGKITGTEALGILKADIDNLGLLLGCGLPDRRFSLSRMATLSRQLDAFFTIYLPRMLATSDDFQDVYTVFAGGDDLFLIGPWKRIANLAAYIRQRFADYVCSNNEVTFSAGISVQKSSIPVDKLAEGAEAALAQAKEVPLKDSLTMYGETVTWAEYAALMQNGQRIQMWLDEKTVSSGMLYRFNELVGMAGQEKLALQRGAVHLEDLKAMKWRAMFGYTLQRNLNPSLKGTAREKAMADVTLMADWMTRYGGAVKIPLWQILYDKRS